MTDLNELVKTFGPVAAMLVAILFTGHRGWWVWKRELDNERERRVQSDERVEQWMQVAFSGTSAAEYLAKARSESKT